MVLYSHFPTLGKSSQHWVPASICKMRIVIFLFGLDIISLGCLNIYTEVPAPWAPRDLCGAWPKLTQSLSSLTDITLEARGWLELCILDCLVSAVLWPTQPPCNPGWFKQVKLPGNARSPSLQVLPKCFIARNNKTCCVSPERETKTPSRIMLRLILKISVSGWALALTQQEVEQDTETLPEFILPGVSHWAWLCIMLPVENIKSDEKKK